MSLYQKGNRSMRPLLKSGAEEKSVMPGLLSIAAVVTGIVMAPKILAFIAGPVK